MRGKRVDLVHANEPHALSFRLAGARPSLRSRGCLAAHRPSSFHEFFFPGALSGGGAHRRRIPHFVEKSVIASGLPAGSIDVIYDGVEIPDESFPANRENARSQFGISQETPCIGNVAAFVPEKGHALLVLALAELRRMFRPELQKPISMQFPECVLLLRGEGQEQAAVQELADELQILDAVKVLAPATDIETVFAAMDIFAFPSHEEPLGSALLAAMAHGLPCRGARPAEEFPKSSKTERTACSWKISIPSAFAAALARLLANPEEARRLGKAARETIAARFSADHMVDATLRLYERLVQGNVTGETKKSTLDS